MQIYFYSVKKKISTFSISGKQMIFFLLVGELNCKQDITKRNNLFHVQFNSRFKKSHCT